MSNGNGNGTNKWAVTWAAYTKLAMALIPFIVALQSWLVAEAFAAKGFRSEGRRMTLRDGQHLTARIDAIDKSVAADAAKLEEDIKAHLQQQAVKLDGLAQAIHENTIELVTLQAEVRHLDHDRIGLADP